MINAELIKALRWCGSEDERHEMCVDESYSCPMWNEDRMTDYCKAELMLAAADIIEAQQVDLRKADEIIAEGIEVSRKSRAALETADKRIAELESWSIHLLKQLPKECEFKRNAERIPNARNRYCTQCGAYLSDEEFENHTIRYCYWCGSKVKGEQE